MPNTIVKPVSLNQAFEMVVVSNVSTLLAVAAKEIIKRGSAPKHLEQIKLPEQVIFNVLNIPQHKQKSYLRNLMYIGVGSQCEVKYHEDDKVAVKLIERVYFNPLAIEFNQKDLAYVADFLVQEPIARLFLTEDEIYQFYRIVDSRLN